jgi:hypothetical protein
VCTGAPWLGMRASRRPARPIARVLVRRGGARHGVRRKGEKVRRKKEGRLASGSRLPEEEKKMKRPPAGWLCGSVGLLGQLGWRVSSGRERPGSEVRVFQLFELRFW